MHRNCKHVIFILALLLSLISNISSSSVQVYINGVYDVESSCIPGTINLTHCSSHAIGTSYICPDLDSSLEYISNATQYGNISVTHVCLPSGYFTLTTPRYLNVSVTLTGLINQSIIRCDYDSNKNIATSEDELQFTLFFSGVSFVRFDCVQFESCPQPLRITLVEDVMISNSRFERFSEAVFDIFNSNNITIVNSSFIDNYSTGTVLLPFRGNTGAVAVGYDNDKLSSVVNPTILVDGCLFMNNTANATAESSRTATNIVSDNKITGRGGGFGLFMKEFVQNITAILTDCKFVNNFAISFGGGVYVGFNGDINQHVVFEGCLFKSNTAGMGAGGVCIVFFTAGIRELPMTCTFHDCNFTQNSARNGGGLYIFPEYTTGGNGNVVFIENCIFEENESVSNGGAVATTSYALFRRTELLPVYQIVNCTFKRNRCTDGIINILYVPFALKGKNLFLSNVGPALRIHGEVNFIDNVIPDGGALYINSFGQIMMFSNSSMTFENNKGQIGAAVVVSAPAFPLVFNRLVGNPHCFLLYHMPNKPLSEVTDLHLVFTNNTALDAAAMFLPSIEKCSWIGNMVPYFDVLSILRWPFLNISEAEDLAGSTNTSLIGSTVTNMHFPNSTITGWPGEEISLPIQLFDGAKQSSADFLQIEAVDIDNEPTTRYKVRPRYVYQQNQKLDIKFAIDHDVDVKRDITFGNASTSVKVIEALIGKTKSYFTLNATRCLAGYLLSSSPELGGLTCQCNTDLEHIRNCGDDQRTILLIDGVWGIEQAHDVNENLVVYPCPPGYCNCILQHNNLGVDVCSFAYLNGDPDKQCVCERKGYLCGDCRDGKGVSALLNHCVDCSNAYGILIGVLVIIDGVLIVILLFKNVSFSALLFPTIFFINMISYVGENFPTSYDKVGRYMYYLNSFLSLYFPYDFCLYSGTTALASFTFRHIPFSLTIIVCSIVVTWFRYSSKNPRHIPWDSLWLLLTLQYSHVIYTSMTVLNCPRVVNENGEFESRWFINGTHDCFTGRHALLGLWAIVVLLVCAVMIPFLALAAVGKISKRLQWFSQLSRCLVEPFKEEVQWWCAVELGRKFVLLLFLVPFPQNTCPPLMILMTMITIYAYVMPYKDTLVNIMELLFQFCALLFLLLRSTRRILTDYLVFPDNSAVIDDCSDETGVALLSWLLFPIAYFPLLVTTTLFGRWLTLKTWKYCKDRNAEIVRQYSFKRNSTAQMNTTNTRHFTLEFIGGILQVIKRRTNADFNDSYVEAGSDTVSTVNSLAMVISNDQRENVTDVVEESGNN